MIIHLRLFYIVCLFIFIVTLFSYFSPIILYSELIPNTNHSFSSSKDFEDDTILKYRSFDLGIELNYFLNWNITYESPYRVELSIINKDKTSTTDSFTPIFDIFVVTPPTNTASLAELVNQTISKYDDDDYYYSNFTLLNQNLNLSDTDWLPPQQQPSAMLNFSYVDSYYDNDIVVNNTEIITIYNDRVYSVLFSAEESKYKEYISDIKQMIKSLKIFSLIPYENFDMGVRMTYPSDWNVTENEYYDEITFTPIEEDTFFEIYSGADTSFDISYTLNNTASLDELVNQTISKYDDNYLF